MALRYILTILALVLPAIAAPPLAQAPLFPSESEGSHGPSLKNARANAAHVFNAIHSSARQWGSSLNHNGMSLYPARVPNNTHFYHGTGNPVAEKGMEWLAFEIEHAEQFAQSRPHWMNPGKPGGPPGEGPGKGPGRPPGGPPGRGPPPPMGMGWTEDMDMMAGLDDDEEEWSKGYLHIYRTTRTLTRLLYIDGTAAGKSSLGTLDTQDLVLRNLTDPDDEQPMNDFQRGIDLCALGAEWGIEGFIRMEMGFEIIFCEFSDGLELESARMRPYGSNRTMEAVTQFEVFRGASLRYKGLEERLKLDYSSMVSAFWYDLNLTNPDAKKQDLPRLQTSDKDELAKMRADLKIAFDESAARTELTNDWRGIVDMIVTRYSDRLQMIAEKDISRDKVYAGARFLTNAYLDYSEFDIAAATEKCSKHYLVAATPQTTPDHLIYESIFTVANKICTTLFQVVKLLGDDSDDENAAQSALEESRSALNSLISYLNWTTWLECGNCAYEEYCFTAIWPTGTEEDRKRPSCMNDTMFSSRYGYWDIGRRPGGKPPKPADIVQMIADSRTEKL